MAKVELWLVRHGETAWSLSGAHTSVTDLPLTEKGRERARALEPMLAKETFAAVFTSPMQRAKETCELAGLGAQMQVEDNLREWNYGEAEGKTTAQMREIYGPAWSVWTNPLKDGETVEAVGARADEVIARALAAAEKAGASTALRSDQEDKVLRVALFAHAHILRILAARWIGLDAVCGKNFALSTGSVSVLGFERENRVVERWNLIRD